MKRNLAKGRSEEIFAGKPGQEHMARLNNVAARRESLRKDEDSRILQAP